MPLHDLIDTSRPPGTPIACDSSVLDDPAEHGRRTRQLLGERLERESIENGLAFKFPGSIGYVRRLVDFIHDERRCCPFATFELAFEPGSRAVWLVISGDEEAAAFVEDAFGAT